VASKLAMYRTRLTTSSHHAVITQSSNFATRSSYILYWKISAMSYTIINLFVQIFMVTGWRPTSRPPNMLVILYETVQFHADADADPIDWKVADADGLRTQYYKIRTPMIYARFTNKCLRRLWVQDRVYVQLNGNATYCKRSQLYIDASILL
jgi:hypothetical protein